MIERYDIIIVGAGHNGLVCAAYLARTGRRVLVLEAADEVGGAAVTREFAPGFRVSAGAHILHMLHPKVVRDLKLADHGLDAKPPLLDTIALGAGGEHLRMGRRAVSGAGLSAADVAVWPEFAKRMERYAAALAPQLVKSPPRLANVGWDNTKKLTAMGWDIRFGLGKTRMRDFLRIVGTSLHEVLDEAFESEALKGAIALDAVLGTNMAPRTPGTVLSYLYRLAGETAGVQGAMALPAGGMGSVTATMAAAATAAGAQIRTGAPVSRVLIEGGRAVGVALAGGEEARGSIVVSNADAKTTLLKLIGARNLEAGFAHRVGNIRARGSAAKLHLALDGLPSFEGLSPADLGQRLVIAPSRHYIEKAFNASKYGEASEAPALEIVIPSLADPSLTPEGKHVLSAVVQYAPYDLKGGWDAPKKEAFVGRALDVIADYAPDIRQRIVASECLTPADIERDFGMAGGHWHHGELAIDQMFMLRPVYGAAQYRTPVDGLYLCGAGCHPGGGVMGAAGHNAAEAVLAGDE